MEIQFITKTRTLILLLGNKSFGNYNSTTSTIAGYAFYPNSSESSAIWINTHFLSSFKKIVTHEIGHALGLKHTEDLANPNSVRASTLFYDVY
ncbi:matrixin family metalloprotease [Candidatus Regiella insecticola]|uniref:matrixin family metalloprotease n=1 Tax=Candidatus Regiella insecticola TaxID=138073 RepID=UPI0015966EF0